MTGYEAAKAKYEALGVDTDRAIEWLKKVPVSLHCWQLESLWYVWEYTVTRWLRC